jgi:hypothetical protein
MRGLYSDDHGATDHFALKISKAFDEKHWSDVRQIEVIDPGRAATFLALEEARSRTSESPTAVKRAHELTKNNTRKDVAIKLDELRAAAEAWIADVAN